MASSDTPANPDKGDEQVPAAGSFLPVNNTRNVETVKSKSTPPSSESESGNKRKRESAVADHNVNTTNEETKPAKELTTPTAADTEQTETTTVVKEVEMKDAESVEIEMHDVAADAEVAFSKSVVEEKSIKDNETAVTDVNASCEGGKEDEEENVEASEKSGDQKESNDEDGCGQHGHVLGEVATSLKQVEEESDTKAKVEVEVKVKKLDHGDVKQNIGEVPKEEPNLGSG